MRIIGGFWVYAGVLEYLQHFSPGRHRLLRISRRRRSERCAAGWPSHGLPRDHLIDCLDVIFCGILLGAISEDVDVTCEPDISKHTVSNDRSVD